MPSPSSQPDTHDPKESVSGPAQESINKNNEGLDSGIGRHFVRAPGSAALLILILAAMSLTLYTLVVLWPPSIGTSGSTTTLFGIHLTPNRDQQLFIVVGLSGAIGGFIHSARSLYWYIGNRVLRRSWVAMYLTLPIIGSALAIVFCLILRGGLLTGEATGQQVNFFGFAAIAALVGLFSPEAAEKLKQVFSTVLAPAESGRDRPPGPNEASVHGIQPRDGRIGDVITIYGASLGQANAVLFHGARTEPASTSDVAVTVVVPEGASTGPISLTIGAKVLTAPHVFQVYS
jgi:IPT/TIG domain-containing protein